MKLRIRDIIDKDLEEIEDENLFSDLLRDEVKSEKKKIENKNTKRIMRK